MPPDSDDLREQTVFSMPEDVADEGAEDYDRWIQYCLDGGR
jgi:hypothetical protein